MQMLAGALKTLKEANCALVGGHTSEGTEAALGFTVTGTVHPQQTLPKGPLLHYVSPTELALLASENPNVTASAIERKPERVEYLLLLTKPLGTGTILAADMRAMAKGRWVAGALRSMVQANRIAGQILQRLGSNACTDVTGFGLLGHLIEMIQYGDAANKDDNIDADGGDDIDDNIDIDRVESGVDASTNNSISECDCTSKGPAVVASQQPIAVELYLNKVPTLTGATECIKMGVLSSLQPQVDLSFWQQFIIEL